MLNGTKVWPDDKKWSATRRAIPSVYKYDKDKSSLWDKSSGKHSYLPMKYVVS